MPLPGVPDSLFTEQQGVITVSQVVNDARCLWRPTPLADVGIDGQIEHVRDRVATARIIFVQVKSGSSYFPGDASTPTYLPSEKHANYWERADLPVIIVLHDPGTLRTLWADARHHLRAHGRTPISVGKPIDAHGVLEALASDGPLPQDARTPKSLITELLKTSHAGFGVAIDFFDLFFQGLVHLGRGLYFGMDLLDYIATNKIAHGYGSSYGLGRAEYELLDRYVDFLLKNDLVRFNFDWFHRHIEVDHMMGQVFGPLTERGKDVVAHVSQVDSDADGYERVAQARAVGMEFGMDLSGARTSYIERFKPRYRGSLE